MTANELSGVIVLGTLDGDERILGLLGRPFALLPRDASGEQLRAALDAVSQGLVTIDPSIAERLFASRAGVIAEAAAPPPESVAETSDHLTTREREVLQLVAEGLPNKTIARRLAISDHTVKFHVASLMTKLGAASRTEAVHLGARRGMVSL
jgi:NarL family two-component system response regulator YdfI